MMKRHKFLDIAGVKDLKSFYTKYPTPDDFFNAFPEQKANFGATLPKEQIMPLSQRGLSMLPVNISQPTMDLQEIEPVTMEGQDTQTTTNPTSAIMGGASAAMQAAGSVVSGAVRALPTAITALYEEQHNPRIQAQPITYNPNPFGTGSKMMYEDGGKVKYRTKSGMQVEYEQPEFVGENITPINTNPTFSRPTLQPVNTTPIPVPNDPYITYERLHDSMGNESISPIFGGNWNYGDVNNIWNQLPDAINNTPVLKGDAWKELWKGFIPNSNSSSWSPINSMRNGGTIYEEGKEYDLSPDEIRKLKSLGYELEVV